MANVSATNLRSGAWGLLAGTVSSLCCAGPSAAVLLGLGSSSALFGIQIERPLALGGGTVLLLAGLVVALRGKRACGLRPGARWRRPALLLAAFAISYGLLGLLAPFAAARQEEAASAAIIPAAPAAPAPALRRATFIVEKMACPPCAAKVRGLLKRKPFVRDLYAEAGDERVTVDYDSRQIDAKGLLAVIPQLFDVKLIGDAPLR